MSTAPERRWPLLALGAVTLLALALRAAGAGSQPLLSDDAMVGVTARNFTELGLPAPVMWNHPRLRDLLVYAAQAALGEGPWALRAWSIAFGTLSVAALGLLLLELGAGPWAALLAAALLAADPLHLDFSRQGINDVHLSFLPVAAILALLRWRRRAHPAWLLLAGGFAGLALATKWSAAFPVGAAAAVVAAVALQEADAGERRARAALLAASLLAVPGAVYLLTWWPWLGRGNDLADLLQLHLRMAHETATHVGYAGTKLPGFPGEVVGAWRWFVQPVWYVDYIPAMPGRQGIPPGGIFQSGVANPLAWMATLPAAAWAAWRWARARDAVAGWLLLLFLAAWLPFALVPRPIWTNSALAAAPFALALVAWAAARLHERLRWPVRVWAAAALALSALLWAPALGASTGPGDAVLRALVSPAALDPANHPSP